MSEREPTTETPDDLPPVSSFGGPENFAIAAGSVLGPPRRPGLLGSLDRFDVLRLLGTGDMGLVFEARDPNDSGRVAIKIVKPEFLKQRALAQRFSVEVERLRALSHPNLVPVLETGARGDVPFFVMPLFARGSLASQIRPGVPFENAPALQVARDVAAALCFIHAKGLVHGDVKPSNVLLDRGGHACLGDLGLSLELNDPMLDITKAHFHGTPAYMSPAVARGIAEDTRRDIYAFGALLYELVTGQPPYSGPTSAEIRRAIIEGPPRPILEINPQADTALVQVSETAMARELSDRYAEMGDVCNDLDRIRAGKQPLRVHRPREPWLSNPLWLARIPFRWRAAGGALLIGAALIAGSRWLLTPQLRVVSTFHSALVPTWDDVVFGHWTGEQRNELLTTFGEQFLVFDATGHLVHHWPLRPAQATAFHVQMVGELPDTHGEAVFLSWTEGRLASVTVLNKNDYQCRTFRADGSEPDPRDVVVTTRLSPQVLTRIHDDHGKDLLALVAFLHSNHGGGSRGLWCFNASTGTTLWTNLTTPPLDGLEVADLRGDGKTEFVCGSTSPCNHQTGADGTDDSHAYIFAIDENGRRLWTTCLAGSEARVRPLLVKGTAGAELLAWVATSEPAHNAQVPELGRIVRLTAQGEIGKTWSARACLRSCIAVDLNGDGRQEVLCTDCRGNVHILDSALNLLQTVAVAKCPKEGRVEMLPIVITNRSSRPPFVALACDIYQETPPVVSGLPDDAPETGTKDECSIILLDSHLRVAERYIIGRKWPVKQFWGLRSADVVGDGSPSLLVLSDHVEVLRFDTPWDRLRHWAYRD